MKRNGLLLLLPSGLALAVLTTAYLSFIAISFTTQELGGIDYGKPLGLHNYIRYFLSFSDIYILAMTVVYSIIISIVVMIIGYPIGYFIVRSDQNIFRSILLGLIVITFFSGSVTRAYSWMILLGNQGILNSTLKYLHIINNPVRMIYNIFGVSIALVHFLVPYFVFVIIGVIKNIPKSCEEAARDLGANPFRVFYRVTLPLSIPGIMTAATLVYSLALSSFVFPLLLGGGRVQFVSDAIYSKIVVSFDRPYAAAASAVYLVVALGTIIVCYRLQRLVVRGIVPKGTAA